MWVAKIKFSEEGTLIGELAQKHEVNLFAFPLSFFYKKNFVGVHITGTIFGERDKINNFCKELKKQKRTINFEIKDGFFVGTIKEPPYSKVLYNENLLHISPALISSQGYEIVEVGSFKKKVLEKFIATIEKKLKGELLFIQKKKIKSISVMRIHPNLTEKQKDAMSLAIKNGYYNVPRKISVQELAKTADLSFATFQVHLRKAEEKLIPYFFE